MNKLLLSLSLVLCLMHGQSIAQKPGDVRWSLLVNPSSREDTIHSVNVQPDGKIVAAGNSYKGMYRTIALGRFDGQTPDSSFGTNGVASTLLDSAHTTAQDVELQPDGKIVVAGGYQKGTNGDFLLVRYQQHGSADSSFGLHGFVQTDIGSNTFDAATALAIQPDGRIIAAGRSGSLLALCRYKTDGTLDSSFDSDGKLVVAGVPGATSMKLQADGRILLCCSTSVIRLLPDGSLDNSFGTNAIAALTDYCNDLALQKDGKILASGGTRQFVLERLDTTGSHDNSFGNGGVVTTNGFVQGSSGNGGMATSVCVQADGRILASGWANFGLGARFRCFAVARYLPNGAADSSFGKFGKVADPYLFAELWGMSYSGVINNSNELVIVGTNGEAISFSQWALAAYNLGPPLAIPAVQGIDAQYMVAPNPAQDFVRIQSAQVQNGPWQLSLCDLSGRALYQETLVVRGNALDKRLSLIDLPAGLYLVKLDNGISRLSVKISKSW